MASPDFSPTRLEAISDGVIAVAITIMVLELHAPHGASPAALMALWPQFESYVVSFLFVATYWVNHRYLFRHLKKVTERVLWTNMALLFLLSLIPFATAYAGQTGLAPFSMALYAVVMLCNGLAYWALAEAIRSQHPRDAIPAAFRGRAALLNFGAIAAYTVAVPTAFVSPMISLALLLLVDLAYVTPLARPA